MNGFIQIEIGGKPIGLKFAEPAIKWFYQAAMDNVIIFFVGDDWSTEGFAKLIQCGYKNNCLIKETELQYTYENFIEYVEQQKQTDDGLCLLAKILTCYYDSKYVKEFEESQKKRLVEMEMMIQKLTLTESKQ